MLVVVVLVALAVTGVALSIGATMRAALRESSWTLIAGVRYAYSHAVTQGVNVRLVMDFEGRTLHLEECPGRVVLTRSDETGEGLGREADDPLAFGPDGGIAGGRTLLDNQMDSIGSSLGGGSAMGSTGNLGGGLLGGDDFGMAIDGLSDGRITDPYLASIEGGFGAGPLGYTKPRFSPLEGTRGEKRSLEGDTRFAVVFTPHDPQPREDGRAFIYFFPGGVTEHAFIQLSDGEMDERVYTVEVHPLTGITKLFTEAIEPEEELDELQEAEG